jgi:hypothetical protein
MNQFSEEFADCVIVSLMNLFFEYDQLSLIEKCRDMSRDVATHNTKSAKAVY